MLSSTGWVQSIVIFLVSLFFLIAAPLPLNVVLGFFCTAVFLFNTSFEGAPGAFFNVGGATVFFTIAAVVNGFLGGTAAVVAAFFSTGFLSPTAGFFSTTIFLVTTGTFFAAASGSFFVVLAGSGFFSAFVGSFLSFFTVLGASSAGRFTALPLGSSLTFLGSSFFPLDCGAACCWPFLVCFTSGSLALGFSGSDFLPLGSALVGALGFSLAGSTLALDLEGCCAADFLPLSCPPFLLSTAFFGAGAY